MKLSVIICTHNPRAHHLQRTLDALKSQTLPLDQWELLLIDNASKEPLAKTWDLSWHPSGRVVLEEKLGLTPARSRGIKESTGENLVFVDDDNLLASNYLQQCVNIDREWPKLGAWGGQIFPEFEGEQPEEWRAGFWTLVLTQDYWSNNYDMATTPIGAGVCIRREVALRYAKIVQEDPIRLAMDRKGTMLTGGGDIDMAHVSCDLGLGTGRFVRLELVHLIPAGRTTDEYLQRMWNGFGYARIMRESFRGKIPPYRPLSDRIMSFLRRLRMPPRNRPIRAAFDEGAMRAIGELHSKS